LFSSARSVESQNYRRGTYVVSSTLAPSGTVAWGVVALVFLTLVRLIVAAVLPLSPDEAYYWVWSRALSVGYFDHPPMVALFVRIGTWLAGDSALGVRLLGPIAAAFGSLMIWDAGNRLMPGKYRGLMALALLNAPPVFGASASIMTPDIPLMLFWIASLWMMARVIATGSDRWWLPVGLFIGLAIVSKYTALFLIVGIAVWLVAVGRHWLLRPMPYVAGAFALALFAPVLWWNWHHGWVSFITQGGRLAEWHPTKARQFVTELIGGQLGLAAREGSGRLPPVAIP
jgi:4-amino-4-deoxy-L-arabinose transferase-like glycosyltransferase